jgi:hypothetical protein
VLLSAVPLFLFSLSLVYPSLLPAGSLVSLVVVVSVTVTRSRSLEVVRRRLLQVLRRKGTWLVVESSRPNTGPS